MSVPADTLRDELLRIRAEYGDLTAEAIVYSASSKSSPIHNEFIWDDSEAAHQYRLAQARKLVKYVKEPYVRPTGEQSRVRYFHAIPQDDNRTVYTPLNEVIEDPIATAILLRQAEREWRTLWGRYQHLSEFVAIVQGTVKVAEPTEK